MALLIPSENSTPEVSAAAIGEELSGSRETRQGLQKSSWRQGSGLEQALEKDRSGQISGVLLRTGPLYNWCKRRLTHQTMGPRVQKLVTFQPVMAEHYSKCGVLCGCMGCMPLLWGRVDGTGQWMG